MAIPHYRENVQALWPFLVKFSCYFTNLLAELRVKWLYFSLDKKSPQASKKFEKKSLSIAWKQLPLLPRKRNSYLCNIVPSVVESFEHTKSPFPPNFHFPSCPPEPTLVLVPRDWCHCCFGRHDFVEAPARTTATVHQNSCANCYLEKTQNAAVLNELKTTGVMAMDI